jgi:hypothetical protein
MVTTAHNWQLRCPKCGTTRDAASMYIIRVGWFRWPLRMLVWCSICRRLRIGIVERKLPGFPVIPKSGGEPSVH